MMNNFLSTFYLDNLKKNKILKNQNFELDIFQIINSFLGSQKTIFVVCPNINEATNYYEKLFSILDNKVLFYPSDSYITIFSALTNGDFSLERLHTIKNLINVKDKFIVVGTYDSFLKLQSPFEKFKDNSFNFQKNKSYNLNKIKSNLIEAGYTYNYIIDKKGDFSFRGSILDIFLFDQSNPIRIDFFDDQIESIKYFNINTQRSEKEINSISFFPITELIYNDKEKEIFKNKVLNYFEKINTSENEWKKINSDLQLLEERKNLESLLIYYSLFYENPNCLLDLNIEKEIFLINPSQYLLLLETENDEKNYLKTEYENNLLLSLKMKKSENYFKAFSPYKLIDAQNEYLPKSTIKSAEIADFRGNLDDFWLFIKNHASKFKIFINLIDTKNQNKINDYFKIQSLNKEENENIFFIKNKHFLFSFIDLENKIILIDENKIFNQENFQIKKNYRSLVKNTSLIRTPDEIKIGDYIVHYDHGIGKYLGLCKLDTTGLEKDYLLILYKDNEKLYVPVEQIDLVLKYHKDPFAKISLSKLGNKTWQRLKLKTKKKIKDLYDELLNLYQFRNKISGYAFYENSQLEKELANDFKFTETKDQQKAIKEILNDMSKEKPMERLLCGDVGFGKTEVSLRASFRAVLNNKQVAILVPTTILAKQHYELFKKRLEKFGVNVKLLTRFQSAKETKQTLLELSKGICDIIIGTHKILSKNVIYKNLGLFVIDEEQRFGVKQKETIKKNYPGVDSLYMSATPIPRTLKMGLSKIKDLSLIETPPQNRFPVQTYLLKRNYLVLKNAILKELARGGQVFYLVSKINQIDPTINKLKKLLPDLKIASITGQMDKKEIEKTLNLYIENKVQLLIATTIIENGIDIPNANTLIIHDANNFGLAQLYQIKGRVGRTNKIAYAYFCVNEFYSLTSDAKKRLDSIKEYEKLGSGYQIAMQDLLIRGSGNLLGSEQSGFIDSVGLLMYLKLVEESLNPDLEYKPEVQKSYVSNHIKEEYIKNEEVRVAIHKKINLIKTKKDLNSLENELEDRFGKLYTGLKLYLQESLYKQLAKKYKIENTEPRKNGVKLIFNTNQNKYLKNLFNSSLSQSIKIDVIQEKDKLILDLNFINEYRNWLYVVNDFLINEK